MILKIITKVLADRIKPILPEIITDNQSAFLSGRLISDNIILDFEAFHYIKKSRKGKKGIWVLSLTWPKLMTEMNGIS